MKRKKIIAVFSVALVCQLFLGMLSFSPTTQASLNDSFTNGKVKPKENDWNSSFVFRIVYADSDNVFPSQNYPKLYLDGKEMPMEEKDPTDNNVVDGKTYIKRWTSGPENLGSHSFYFYVRNNSGENRRCPENEVFEGPLVEKIPTKVSLNLERKGKNIIFSGSLETIRENKENHILSEKNIIFYKVKKYENSKVGTKLTDENGDFVLSTVAPEAKGIFRFIALFAGGENYARSQNDTYLHTLNTYYVIALFLFFLVLLGAIWYLFTRGINRSSYLTPMLLGSLLGLALFTFLGVFGLLIGGLFLGYTFSSEVEGWLNQFKIGSVGGLLLFVLYVSFILVNVFVFPETVRVQHSLTQGDFLRSFLIGSGSSIIGFVLTLGVGAILGEFLRRILK